MKKYSYIIVLCALLSAAFISGNCAKEKKIDILSVEEREWLEQNADSINVPIGLHAPPNAFYNKKGEYAGIAVDYLLLIEKKINAGFKRLPVKTWTEFMNTFSQGTGHIHMGLAQTPERSKTFLFTQPFLEFPYVIVVSREITGQLTLDKMRGMKIAVVKGYAIENFIRKKYNYLTISPTLNNLTGLRDVSFGKVDAMVINISYASYIIEKEGIANLRIAGDSGYLNSLSIATPIYKPMLNSILKKALASISKEEANNIYRKWVKLERDAFYLNKKFLIAFFSILGIVLVVIGVILTWNRTLRKTVAYRTLELKKSEEKFRGIFENAINGIFQFSLEGNLITANPSLARIFGYASPEKMTDAINNASKQIFTNQQDVDSIRFLIREQGFITDFETECIRKNNSTFTVCINSYSITDESGKPLYLEGILEDITEKKASKTLKLARDAAEASTRAKSEFLASMSHEIRTPMNAILGFSELLESKIKDPQLAEYISAILSSGKTLLNIINDILDLSKIEAGRIELQYSSVNIHSIAKGIKQVFSMKLNEKDLDFRINIDPSLPEGLLLDEVRLHQVLFNIVGNAIKFTEAGHITLSVQKLDILNHGSIIDVILSIEDTGIGIAKDQKGLVFEPFRQQKGQRVSQYGGTGLGLAISKRLVELMGGEISLESEAGKGSTFTITIKDAAVAAVKDTPESTNKINREAIQFEKASILIVDDIDYNRTLLKGFLDFPNLTLIEASNGKIAVDSAKQNQPTLVLMDIKMPEMDGYEAITVFKTNMELKDIPVIAVTASAMKSDEKKIHQLGFADYLRKPVSMNDLVQAVLPFLPHTLSRDAFPLKKQLADAKKDSFLKIEANALSGEVKAKLPELAAILENEWIPAWTIARKNFIIDKIRGFAGEVEKLGIEFGFDPLVDWSLLLKSQAQTFDVEKITDTLDYFPELVKKIKEI
ncbi:MAG: transporter substrate-binding domain-containing protein [bacterium]|nr:transporter substrate-binding domain-containing protein [bacterium]